MTQTPRIPIELTSTNDSGEFFADGVTNAGPQIVHSCGGGDILRPGESLGTY